MNGIQAIRDQLKLVSILILTLFLTNCSVVREPAVVGGTNIGMTCAGVVNDPAVIAACVATGSVVAIDQVWNDDFNEHKKYFVDHKNINVVNTGLNSQTGARIKKIRNLRKHYTHNFF